MKIDIEFNGDFPNLCSGDLVVIIDGERWIFPSHCLLSGGSVNFDGNWMETVISGSWTITDWPDNFPEKLKEMVSQAVNDSIPHGCCGGCV